MPQPKPIPLARRWPRYKLGYEDPAYTGSQDPWHRIIECRAGHIAPSGGDYLIATVRRRTKAHRELLMDDPPIKVRVLCEADDGANVEFRAKDWRYVFKLMGARTR